MDKLHERGKDEKWKNCDDDPKLDLGEVWSNIAVNERICGIKQR